MAQVAPLRGVRYSARRVPDLGAVVTPPYDVISPAEQERFYRASEHNVIRLELARDEAGEDREDRYARSARLFRRWLAEGILERETEPVLYVYRQEFAAAGRRYVRTGFMGLLRLVEFSRGVVLPHEKTLPKPKADRLELLRAARANFSPIMGLYWDAGPGVARALGEALAAPPVAEVTDPEGVRNSLWVLGDPAGIAAVCGGMEPAYIVIADGHHRYETALTYRDERHAAGGESDGASGFDFTLMMFIDLADPGVVTFPTHRTLRGWPGFDPQGFPTRAAQLFAVEERGVSDAPALLAALDERIRRARGAGPAIFAAYLGGGRGLILTLQDRTAMDRAVGDRFSRAWKELDVTVLHTLVLGRILGLDQVAQAGGEHVSYTRDAAQAMGAVDRGEAQIAFLLTPIAPSAVREVALAGDTLPQKSTYFYPKLLTGLVINDLDAEVPAPAIVVDGP